jgi:hypothetical protein
VSIIPLESRSATSPPDVSALVWALRRVPLEWWAPILPGEDLEQARARRAAVADIFDDLLDEVAVELAGQPTDRVGVAW